MWAASRLERGKRGETMNDHNSERPSPVDFYRSDALLTDDERAVRDRVRAFAEAHLRPIAREAWERAEFPSQLLPELVRLGVLGGTVRGYGCPGLSSVALGLAMQEIGRVDSSFATYLAIGGGLVPVTLALCGSEEQKSRWLPLLAGGEAIGAFALTEPDHGSDVSQMATRARRDGDHYVLDGAKRWIGNASICDVAVVWARAEDGIA